MRWHNLEMFLFLSPDIEDLPRNVQEHLMDELLDRGVQNGEINNCIFLFNFFLFCFPLILLLFFFWYLCSCTSITLVFLPAAHTALHTIIIKQFVFKKKKNQSYFTDFGNLQYPYVCIIRNTLKGGQKRRHKLALKYRKCAKTVNYG